MGRRFIAGLLLVMLLATAFPWPAQAVTRPTLRWGSHGPSVTLAQQRLQAWGYYKGRIDGVYGPKMYAATILFQRRNGLRVDGVVGTETWTGLGLPSTPARRTTTRAATRSDDLNLLARTVAAEARGEPYEGQVAVAAVLLNRLRDSRFPNTLAGIVYQPQAFESVSNGTIYAPPSASALRAARDALNGWDPSGGAVFFWNPAKATSAWIWSRPIITQIGDHVFAR